jgi:N-acetylmuramoyl-L-alanine amidase
MFSNSRRTSKSKRAILQGVYHDNLRMSGKFIEPVGMTGWHRMRRHIRRLSVVALVVAACSFPNFSLDETLPQMVIVSASVDTQKAAETSASGEILTVEPGGDTAVRLPIRENPIFNHQQDYSLLFSGSNPVRLSSLFGLEVKKIVIDPGHGGKDPGAIGVRGTQEKDITLDVALRLKKRLLQKEGYHVLLTRESDKTLSLAQRVEFSKENRSDLFISLHVNSLPDQRVNLIETYYFGPPLTSEILRLAEQENKDSHFSIGELDAVIQDIGKTLKRQESALLAASIQESLFRNVRNHDDRVLDVGIKTAPFVVLARIEAPSVLVEISCLTNEEEEVKLASAEYREKIASFIEEGVALYLETQHSKKLRGEHR